MKIAVCIATFRRPKGLARLLDGLDALRFDSIAPPDIELVIVDNDPEGSAREAVEQARENTVWPVRYEHEPRRGISQARNRAVEVALSASADFLAFIDDDEVPDPVWLDELLRVQAAYNAEVVAGPVVPLLEPGVAKWIAAGGFFERPRLETGRKIRIAITANVLVAAEVFRRDALRFDERLGTIGGEDSHLFARVHRLGHRMVWADEAVVREWIPASRAEASWLLRRAYRSGGSWSMIAYDLDPRASTRFTRIAKGLARITQGIIAIPFGCLKGRAGLVRALQTACLGAGSVTGAFGFAYEEYRQVHGS